jgi:hypothetical protein
MGVLNVTADGPQVAEWVLQIRNPEQDKADEGLQAWAAFLFVPPSCSISIQRDESKYCKLLARYSI